MDAHHACMETLAPPTATRTARYHCCTCTGQPLLAWHCTEVAGRRPPLRRRTVGELLSPAAPDGSSPSSPLDLFIAPTTVGGAPVQNGGRMLGAAAGCCLGRPSHEEGLRLYNRRKQHMEHGAEPKGAQPCAPQQLLRTRAAAARHELLRGAGPFPLTAIYASCIEKGKIGAGCAQALAAPQLPPVPPNCSPACALDPAPA